MDRMKIENSQSLIFSEQRRQTPARNGSFHLKIILPEMRNSQQCFTTPLILVWRQSPRVWQVKGRIDSDRRETQHITEQGRGLKQTVSSQTKRFRHQPHTMVEHFC